MELMTYTDQLVGALGEAGRKGHMVLSSRVTDSILTARYALVHGIVDRETGCVDYYDGYESHHYDAEAVACFQGVGRS